MNGMSAFDVTISKLIQNNILTVQDIQRNQLNPLKILMTSSVIVIFSAVIQNNIDTIQGTYRNKVCW